MRNTLVLAAAALAMGHASPMAAQAGPDSAAFVIRLGSDTTAVERYVRSGDVLTAEAVQRSPSTSVHRLQLRFGANGRLASAEYQLRPSPGAAPTASRTIRYPARAGDSTVIELTQGGTVRRVALAADDAIPVVGPFYAPYELALQRFVRSGGDTARLALLTGTSLGGTRLRRAGGDTIALTNQFNEPMRARVDGRGRLLQLQTPAYVSVERTGWVDLERLAEEFAARDAAGRGLGQLSPRAAFRTRVGEANVWVDYSRPGLRGRPLWGALVPFGQVWRLGANDATHLATDRPLRLGPLALEPGTYTLFLLPVSADAWTLIVNRRTGTSGLDYDPAADVGRVPLTVETLARPVEQLTIGVSAGNLQIAWGDRRGSASLEAR